jgi:hypothetical protein
MSGPSLVRCLALPRGRRAGARGWCRRRPRTGRTRSWMAGVLRARGAARPWGRPPAQPHGGAVPGPGRTAVGVGTRGAVRAVPGLSRCRAAAARAPAWELPGGVRAAGPPRTPAIHARPRILQRELRLLLARYDVGDGAGRTRPARQACHRSLDMTVRLSRPPRSASRASAEPLRRMESLVQVAGHYADAAA